MLDQGELAHPRIGSIVRASFTNACFVSMIGRKQIPFPRLPTLPWPHRTLCELQHEFEGIPNLRFARKPPPETQFPANQIPAISAVADRSFQHFFTDELNRITFALAFAPCHTAFATCDVETARIASDQAMSDGMLPITDRGSSAGFSRWPYRFCRRSQPAPINQGARHPALPYFGLQRWLCRQERLRSVL